MDFKRCKGELYFGENILDLVGAILATKMFFAMIKCKQFWGNWATLVRG